jgi:hypothetical protein
LIVLYKIFFFLAVHSITLYLHLWFVTEERAVKFAVTLVAFPREIQHFTSFHFSYFKTFSDMNGNVPLTNIAHYCEKHKAQFDAEYCYKTSSVDLSSSSLKSKSLTTDNQSSVHHGVELHLGLMTRY